MGHLRRWSGLSGEWKFLKLQVIQLPKKRACSQFSLLRLVEKMKTFQSSFNGNMSSATLSSGERQRPTRTHDPGCLRYICSASTQPIAWQSVYQKNSLRALVRFFHARWELIEGGGHSAFADRSIRSKRARILSSAEVRRIREHSAASREAGRRIARAPGLSCLYKQALIFLSSTGTSAIYSRPCGRGPDGAGEILLQSSWAPRGLCVRIDFTGKRGEGLKPLSKGRTCHQRARRVKSHMLWTMRDAGRRDERSGLILWMEVFETVQPKKDWAENEREKRQNIDEPLRLQYWQKYIHIIRMYCSFLHTV